LSSCSQPIGHHRCSNGCTLDRTPCPRSQLTPSRSTGCSSASALPPFAHSEHIPLEAPRDCIPRTYRTATVLSPSLLCHEPPRYSRAAARAHDLMSTSGSGVPRSYDSTDPNDAEYASQASHRTASRPWATPGSHWIAQSVQQGPRSSDLRAKRPIQAGRHGTWVGGAWIFLELFGRRRMARRCSFVATERIP
jgi:hypothetical protein